MEPLAALLDTTVFCGALVKPDGINMKLLKLGATPLYRPIISQSVIAEFIHKACCDGIGRGPSYRVYSPESIALFLDAFSALLDHQQAVLVNHTYKFVSTFPGNTPLWVVISKFADYWPVEAQLSEKLRIPIKETDLGDFHLFLSAIQSNPDVIVSSNKKDLQVLQDFCTIMTPGEFFKAIT
jgi:predicted nucleic acid-binding protein